MLAAPRPVFGTSIERTMTDCRQVRFVEEMDVIGCLRPEAAGRRPIRIVAIRVEQYALHRRAV